MSLLRSAPALIPGQNQVRPLASTAFPTHYSLIILPAARAPLLTRHSPSLTGMRLEAFTAMNTRTGLCRRVAWHYVPKNRACWSSGNALDLSSGGSRFESPPEIQLCLRYFVIFLNLSRRNLSHYTILSFQIFQRSRISLFDATAGNESAITAPTNTETSMMRRRGKCG